MLGAPEVCEAVLLLDEEDWTDVVETEDDNEGDAKVEEDDNDGVVVDAVEEEEVELMADVLELLWGTPEAK